MYCPRYIFRFFSAWLAGVLLFVALAGYFPSSKCRCRSLDKGGLAPVTVVGLAVGSSFQDSSPLSSSSRDAHGDAATPLILSSSLSRGEPLALGNASSGWANGPRGRENIASDALAESGKRETKGNSSKRSGSKGGNSRKAAPDGVCPFSQLRGLSSGLFLEVNSLIADIPHEASFLSNTISYQELLSFHEAAKHQARAPPCALI